MKLAEIRTKNVERKRRRTPPPLFRAENCVGRLMTDQIELPPASSDLPTFIVTSPLLRAIIIANRPCIPFQIHPLPTPSSLSCVFISDITARQDVEQFYDDKALHGPPSEVNRPQEMTRSPPYLLKSNISLLDTSVHREVLSFHFFPSLLTSANAADDVYPLMPRISRR